MVIFQRDVVHIGENAAAFIICRFSFQCSETVIDFLLIDDVLKPCIIIHCHFCVEHDDMGRIQHFTFVKHIIGGSGFCDACFAFFRTGDNKVPRPGIGVGWAVL